MALIECIPNFSEGRAPHIIQQIANAVALGGADVLDVSSDADHNRTVITFIGDADQIAESAFRAVQAAANLIDLSQHAGVHPRIGATDVVPFVPLRDATLADCVTIAQQVGQRIGDELAMPVYLYEAAAQQAGRTNLADIRRGGYEELQARINNDAAMQPDFGPAQVGKAGAVVVGARGPLVAYNAYLNTTDVTIARQIARAVRTSSGGLPYLKAIGLLVGGRAQVSMNVINFQHTSLHTITEAVRAEAAKHGTTVTETELVGLVPQAALIDAALDYLGLPRSTRALILEQRIGQATTDFQEITFE
jgi:glutamate formiminotransferase